MIVTLLGNVTANDLTPGLDLFDDLRIGLKFNNVFLPIIRNFIPSSFVYQIAEPLGREQSTKEFRQHVQLSEVFALRILRLVAR